MGFTIYVDCTPEEGRAFLGWLDVKVAQDAVMGEIEKRMRRCLAAMRSATVLKMWLPNNVPGLETLQKAVCLQFSGTKD